MPEFPFSPSLGYCVDQHEHKGADDVPAVAFEWTRIPVEDDRVSRDSRLVDTPLTKLAPVHHGNRGSRFTNRHGM